jgi:hypothetical protein
MTLKESVNKRKNTSKKNDKLNEMIWKRNGYEIKKLFTHKPNTKSK